MNCGSYSISFALRILLGMLIGKSEAGMLQKISTTRGARGDYLAGTNDAGDSYRR